MNQFTKFLEGFFPLPLIWESVDYMIVEDFATMLLENYNHDAFCIFCVAMLILGLFKYLLTFRGGNQFNRNDLFCSFCSCFVAHKKGWVRPKVVQYSLGSSLLLGQDFSM